MASASHHFLILLVEAIMREIGWPIGWQPRSLEPPFPHQPIVEGRIGQRVLDLLVAA